MFTKFGDFYRNESAVSRVGKVNQTKDLPKNLNEKIPKDAMMHKEKSVKLPEMFEYFRFICVQPK